MWLQEILPLGGQKRRHGRCSDLAQLRWFGEGSASSVSCAARENANSSMRATGRNLWHVCGGRIVILAWNAIQVWSRWIHIWPLVFPLSDRSGLYTRLMAQQDHMKRFGWNPVQYEYLLLDHEEELQFHILVQHCGWQHVDLEVQVNTIGFDASCGERQCALCSMRTTESLGWSSHAFRHVTARCGPGPGTLFPVPAKLPTRMGASGQPW